jgi:hypothetical protein
LLQQKIHIRAARGKISMRDSGLVVAAVDSLASTCNHAAHEFFVSTTCKFLVAPLLTARGQGMDVYLD